MTLDEAIKHVEEVAEEQRSNAHVHEDMMIFNQSIKHNTEAKYHEELMNECIECGKEHRQLAEWLKELKSLKEKDEAKTVRYEGDGYADGAMVYDYAFCPNCDHIIEEDSENWECDFCPNCGQRLRW